MGPSSVDERGVSVGDRGSSVSVVGKEGGRGVSASIVVVSTVVVVVISTESA